MHRSFPKPPRRLTHKRRERAENVRAWHVTCHQVNVRDRWRCRCCHRRVVSTLTLCPERLEHHHIVPRSRAPERMFDVTNVVSLCCSCHTKVTHHELDVIGTNAEGPLVFRSTSLGGS